MEKGNAKTELFNYQNRMWPVKYVHVLLEIIKIFSFHFVRKRSKWEIECNEPFVHDQWEIKIPFER